MNVSLCWWTQLLRLSHTQVVWSSSLAAREWAEPKVELGALYGPDGTDARSSDSKLSKWSYIIFMVYPTPDYVYMIKSKLPYRSATLHQLLELLASLRSSWCHHQAEPRVPPPAAQLQPGRPSRRQLDCTK